MSRRVGETSSSVAETGVQPTWERKCAYFVLPSAGKRSMATAERPAAIAFCFIISAAAAKPGEPCTRWNRPSSRTVSSAATPSTSAWIAAGTVSGQKGIARSWAKSDAAPRRIPKT